jgi:hypothetical protein
MTDDSPGADFVDEAERRDALPEHERDDDRTAGGGLLSGGVSATDRGTGDLTGTAQGPEADNDESDPDANTKMLAGVPAGASQPFAPIFVEENEQEGALADEDESRG